MEGSGDSTWWLARKALGTSAFGFNMVEIEPGGQITEHDEEQSGQVGFYAILEGGRAADRRRRPPRADGTFASSKPPVSRTILNRSDTRSWRY